jgi:hypothetical protein
VTSFFMPVTYGNCAITGKTSYPVRRDAKHVAYWHSRQGAGRLSVYRCGGHFHIGHLGKYRIANGRAA